MIALIQRVLKSSVSVESKTVGAIGNGLNILLGVGRDDTKEDCEYLAKKTADMRIFSDSDGKMNLSIQDVKGSALVISQFTLHANCRRGNRPGFSDSAQPEKAKDLYVYYMELLRQFGIHVEEGVFGADMKVEIENDGPVTIILDSKIRLQPR